MRLGTITNNASIGNRVGMAAFAAVAALVVVAGSNPTHAATITMTGTNGAGESWTTAGDWSNNATASAGNDYVVGTTGGAPRVIRTPGTTGPFTFPGDSLELAGGQLNLTADGNRINMGSPPAPPPAYDTNTTINNLLLTGGAVIVNAVNSKPVSDTQFLHGNSLTFSGATANWIRTGGTTATQARNVTVTSPLHGSGTVRLVQRGAVTFGGTGGTFGGTFISGGVNLTIPGVVGTYSNDATQFTLVTGTTAGSLGTNANFTVDVFSSLDLNFDWTTTGALTLLRDAAQDETNAPMILDQNLTVGALDIGGTLLGPGTYSYAQLNTDFGLFFREGGSGSITVGTVAVPEPATVGALAAAGGLTALRRRRVS